MTTLQFLKEVLSGKKHLMKTTDLVGIPKIPRIPEINASLIWNEIKDEQQIVQYFPSAYVSSNRVPDREYMFNVR